MAIRSLKRQAATTRGGKKMNAPKTIEERAVAAMIYTWNAIGADLEAAGGEGSLSNETLRDCIPDCNFMESYGQDDEAVKWFRSMGYDERQIVLRKAFP